MSGHKQLLHRQYDPLRSYPGYRRNLQHPLTLKVLVATIDA